MAPSPPRITSPGLGELLRHLIDLLDGGSRRAYEKEGLDIRPRYTPVMRVLGDTAVSVTDLCDRVRISQGAVSQTLKLMEADDLVQRLPTGDGRSRTVVLTRKGHDLRQRLDAHWQRRLHAVAALEQEIDLPLRANLERAIEALERDGFDERLVRCSVETER